MPFDYSPTVLLVEDEPHIRRFVRESLQAEGCTCTRPIRSSAA
jgi:two-component system KDP operon response regulator KdpE